MNSSKEEQFDLISLLMDIGKGSAESEEKEIFLKRFLPISEHINAVSERNYFILGERGTGKSELFRVVFVEQKYNELYNFLNKKSPEKKNQWRGVCPNRVSFPVYDSLVKFKENNQNLESFWLFYVYYHLPKEIKIPNSLFFQQIHQIPFNFESISNQIDENKNELIKVIDLIDKENKKKNQIIHFGYDELEILGDGDSEISSRYIESLISFWGFNLRRWETLKPKIFIRNDLFNKSIHSAKAEATKILQNKLEIKWKKDNLLTAIIKRISNTDNKLKNYLSKIISFSEKSPFGFLPVNSNMDKISQIFSDLFGESFGEQMSKGKLIDWLLFQARLGYSNYSPRVLIRIIEKTASFENDNFQNSNESLLNPNSFLQVISEVSKDHVTGAMSEEWPWLAGLKSRFEDRDIHYTPISKNKLIDVINYKWFDSWGNFQNDLKLKPPARDSWTFLKLLIELGIVFETNKGVFDFPDIYRYGLGLEKRGGVGDTSSETNTGFRVYITDVCLDKAKDQNTDKNLENVRNKIIAEQSISNLDTFASSFRKKTLPNSTLLICYEYEDIEENNQIVIFLDILKYSEKEYSTFFKYNQKNHTELYRYFNVEKAIQNAKDFFGKLNIEKGVSLVSPSEEEEEWLLLNSNTVTEEDDIYIFESFNWVETIKKTDNLHLLSSIWSDLGHLLNNISLLEEYGNLYYNDKFSFGIEYYYFPSVKKLILLDITRSKENKRHERTIERFNTVKDDGRIEVINDEIKKQCARSYPYYILIDLPIWKDVENSVEANLTLSPEEMNILNELKNSEDKSEMPRFPLFVNGRAGSGKTTVIQYVIKPYLEFCLEKEDNNLFPIYLTYNNQLLLRAKETMKQLITKNHEALVRKQDSNSTRIDQLDSTLDKTFKIFHEFLFELMPEHISKKYQRNKKISYKQFKEFYEKEFKHSHSREYPDLVWHTIRTYIKGMRDIDSNLELNPIEYAEISEELRTIEAETYKKIYTKYYEDWYLKLCKDEGFWDEQDLVAEVLRSNYYLKFQYPCIVCDESQDFTKIELNLILRLNLFYHRKLKPYQLRNLPLVFAGDPMQTINPTGFRWESVKALFYQQLIGNLDSNGKAKLEINYKELQYNYRSQGSIVKFLNVIQLLRGALFSMDIKPQEAWRSDENTIVPKYYKITESVIKDKLKRDLTNLIIIVDCDSSEVDEFIEKDSFLKEIASTHNILSPMQAKGSDWQHVILYKFGETAPEELKKMISDAKIDATIPEDNRLKIAYFLNRLYVAASRPRKSLIVIDTEEAIKRFWKFTIDGSHFDKMTTEYKDRVREEWKESSLCYLEEGGSEVLPDTGDKPFETADKFFDIGMNEENPDYLRRAIQNYNNADMPDCEKAKKAEAFSNKFELKYREAGKQFVDLKLYEEALICFFKEQDYSSILSIRDKPEIIDRIEICIAQMITSSNDKDINKISHYFKKLTEFLLKEKNILEKEEWIFALDSVLNSIVLPFLEKSNYTNLLTPLLDLILRLGSGRMKIDFKKVGKVYFQLNNFKTAYKYFEEAGEQKSSEYIISKAKSLSFPENILPLFEIKEYNQVNEFYRENKGYKYTAEQYHVILMSFEKLGKYSEAYDLLFKEPKIKITDCIHIISSYIRNKDTIEEDLTLHFFNVYTSKLFANKEYDDILELLDSQNYGLFLKEKFKAQDLEDIFNNPQAVINQIVGIVINVIANHEDKLEIKVASKFSDKFEKFRKRVNNDDDWSDILNFTTYDTFWKALEKLNKIIHTLSFFRFLYSYSKNNPSEYEIRDQIFIGKKFLKAIEDREKLEIVQIEKAKLESEKNMLRIDFEELDRKDAITIVKNPERKFSYDQIEINRKNPPFIKISSTAVEFEVRINTVTWIINISFNDDTFKIDLRDKKYNDTGVTLIEADDLFTYIIGAVKTKIFFAPKLGAVEVELLQYSFKTEKIFLK